MIKDLAVNALLVTALGGGMTAGKYYADHTYISMNDYQQSNTQNRVWSLQDQIKTIQRKAAREGRALTTLELQDIEEIKIEIDNLKGK
jgi:peptidoglycan hydrolase CwlO-like protein